MRHLFIDGKTISDSEPAYVIAEIGHNHAHRMERAMAMVDSAAASGASAVKFQTRSPEETYRAGVTQGAYHYQSSNPQWMDPVYGEHRKKLEPTPHEWQELFAHCRSVGITAFSTPFDFASLDLLEVLEVPAYKVASGDATNIPLIEAIAETGKPTIISTGGLYQRDVDRLYNAFTRFHTRLALLQCSCVYPCPSDAMNLRVIEDYRHQYPDTVVGLSTHNPSWYPSLVAYGLGARIFEHHYTNNRKWKGTDNHFSLTPPDLAEFVGALEEAREAMGSRVKIQYPAERAPTTERQKSLVWASQVLQYEEITREDIKIQCPGDGIPPYYIDLIVGGLAAYTVGRGERIGWQDVLVGARGEREFQEAVVSV